MDTYTERHNDRPFSVEPGTVQFLAVIFDATVGTKKVRVAIREGSSHPLAGSVISGVARHVCEPDGSAFPKEWTQDTRLRVSGNGEFFVALNDIEALVIEEEA